MSRSYRQEVLVVNHPSPSPDPPDRGYNNEAHMQGNLSLDSAPPSSAYSTSRRFDLSSTASASSEAPLFSDARCPLCSPQTSLLDETVLMQTGMLSFVQLNPCGHTYCTRCFETLLLASAMTSTSVCSRALSTRICSRLHSRLLPPASSDSNNAVHYP